MNLAILQCDDVLEKFQAEFGNYPEMIVEFLREEFETLNVQVFDIRQGNYPEDLECWDLYAITGSKASVYDGSAWIDPLVSFVQALDQADKKVFGICFGHQIMALAKGARVEKSDKGWGVGVATNRVILRPDWLLSDDMPLKSHQLNLLVSHQDQVLNLPDDAVLIAESDFCPYFMVQWSDNLLSVQGHPEWKAEYSSALVNNRRNIIPTHTVELALDSLSQKLDNTLFAKWVKNFAFSRGQSH